MQFVRCFAVRLLPVLTKLTKLLPMSRIGNGIVTVKPQKKIRGYHVRTQCEKTALVVIDLQEGILPFAGGPHRADDVVTRAARLAEKCRQQGSPVIMVRVGWSADFAEALKQPVDAQAGGHALPDNWGPQALGKQDGDIEVTKRQWAPSMVPTSNCSYAVAVLIPLFSAASPPTSALNPPRVMPGAGLQPGYRRRRLQRRLSRAAPGQHDPYFPAHRPRAQHRGRSLRLMIYIGLRNGRTRSGCVWASPALKSMLAILTVWRVIRPFTPCRRRKSSPAGMSKPTIIFASALNSRPPFRIRPPCAIATT